VDSLWLEVSASVWTFHINHLNTEKMYSTCLNLWCLREREEKESDIVRHTTFWRGSKKLYIHFEGSPAVPACPFGRGNTYDLNYFIRRWKGCIIVKFDLTLWGPQDEILVLPLGGAACEACSATWNLVTNSAFAPGLSKTMENLDRVGPSQDFPDANWLLASSPALSTRTLTLLPIWLLFHLKK
jgi:hypothetical protein